jgi:hypothetical protein
MSDEAKDKDKKQKGDYAEVGFEIGNIEFEAKGRSLVVERMFRLLLDRIEHGKLVATVTLPDYEEEEEEETSDQLEDVFNEETEEEDSLTRTLREIDEAVPPIDPKRRDEDESMTDDIPSEAYLDPPPAWDSLDDESPPKSDSEKDAAEE